MGIRGACATCALFCLLVPAVSCEDDPNSLDSRRSGAGSSSSSDGDNATDDGSQLVVEKGSTSNETCFNAINAYRKQNGLTPYQRWTDKETCANGQAKSDSASEDAHGSFTKCGELAQNECPGTPGVADKALPRCLSMMWREGPGGGHYDNMSSRTYTKVACGVFTTASGETWSVQNFR